MILTSGRKISNLLLDPLKKDDDGRYVCRAGNRVNEISYTVDLVVLCKYVNHKYESIRILGGINPCGSQGGVSQVGQAHVGPKWDKSHLCLTGENPARVQCGCDLLGPTLMGPVGTNWDKIRQQKNWDKTGGPNWDKNSHWVSQGCLLFNVILFVTLCVSYDRQ